MTCATTVPVLCRFHYDSDEAEQGMPWEIATVQMENRTLYVGGAAGYETVEDSLQLNLELVDRFFRNSAPLPNAVDQPAMEQQIFHLDCVDVDRLRIADNGIFQKPNLNVGRGGGKNYFQSGPQPYVIFDTGAVSVLFIWVFLSQLLYSYVDSVPEPRAFVPFQAVRGGATPRKLFQMCRMAPTSVGLSPTVESDSSC